jgi:hypothetical protein
MQDEQNEKSFTIPELADLTRLPVAVVDAALAALIARRHTALDQAYYTVPELAERWRCSATKVRDVLRESEYKVWDITGKQSRERIAWRVPRAVVERIEARMRRFTEEGVLGIVA